MSSTKFTGRAGLVTGASSGIGRAIAQHLGSLGMELWLVGRSREGLEQTARTIESQGGRAHCEVLDLAQNGAVGDLVRKIGALHPHLFVVVNNAGVMHPETIMSGRMDRWRAMFDINVLAPLDACRAAVEVMRGHRKPGHLINISSVASRFENGGVYGASKLALEAIGRSLRGEIEMDDIRVTTIVPGGFNTNLARDVEAETWEAIGRNLQKKGIDPRGPQAGRLMGDPLHIARAIEYVLDQPIDINFEDLTIRPPVDSSW